METGDGQGDKSGIGEDGVKGERREERGERREERGERREERGERREERGERAVLKIILGIQKNQ